MTILLQEAYTGIPFVRVKVLDAIVQAIESRIQKIQDTISKAQADAQITGIQAQVVKKGILGNKCIIGPVVDNQEEGSLPGGLGCEKIDGPL